MSAVSLGRCAAAGLGICAAPRQGKGYGVRKQESTGSVAKKVRTEWLSLSLSLPVVGQPKELVGFMTNALGIVSEGF